MAERGKFIVLYGANNLGKSRQIDILGQALETKGISTQRIKYPRYDLQPTGPMLDDILRKGAPKPPELEFQRIFTQNRLDFESTLKSYLKKGRWVIAEDYKGTGIAWGLVRGAPLEELEKMNAPLLPEDLAVLLWGRKFSQGQEAGHINETDDELWRRAQGTHLFLAYRYGWELVHATGAADEVHWEILSLVRKRFLSKLMI